MKCPMVLVLKQTIHVHHFYIKAGTATSVTENVMTNSVICLLSEVFKNEMPVKHSFSSHTYPLLDYFRLVFNIIKSLSMCLSFHFYENCMLIDMRKTQCASCDSL